jgi:hypothetical protein
MKLPAAMSMQDKSEAYNSALNSPQEMSLREFLELGEKYRDVILAELDRDYFYMLRNGATTFWETIRGEEDFGEAGSLCHGWSSGPVAFLTEHVLGVEIAAAGCKKIVIKPNLGSLSFAKGSIATPYGKVEIEHTRMLDGSIQTKVNAPEEIRITV